MEVRNSALDHASSADAATPKSAAGCHCVADVNAMLANHNTQLLVPLFGPTRIICATHKLDEKKRGKPAHMFASYCPFCGEKYAREASLSSAKPAPDDASGTNKTNTPEAS